MADRILVALVVLSLLVVSAPRVYRYGFGAGRTRRVNTLRGMLLADLAQRGDLEIRSDHPAAGETEVRFTFRDVPPTAPFVGKGATLDDALLDVRRQVVG